MDSTEPGTELQVSLLGEAPSNLDLVTSVRDFTLNPGAVTHSAHFSGGLSHA